MKISVITPFYKGERYINKLLDSLQCSYQMSNKLIDLEVIIVVDSVETSSVFFKQFNELYHDLGLRIYFNSINIGVAATRDYGLRLSFGDFVTFIDQDDFVDEKYFTTLESLVYSEADFFLFNGYIYNTVNKKKVKMYYQTPKLSFKNLINENLIITPSLFIVRKSFIVGKKINFQPPFREYRGVDDYYFLLQVFKEADLEYKYNSTPLIYYCIHYYLLIRLFVIDDVNDPIKYIYTITGASATVILFISILISLIKEKINLMKYRKEIGILGFFYAFLHFTNFVVFDAQFDLEFILKQTIEKPFIYLGMIAFFILLC